MTNEEETLNNPDTVQESGWDAIRDIIGDFLIIFVGTWLGGRGMVSLIAVFGAPDKPPVLWLILQIITAIGIISLGVDRWRAHSRASAQRLPNRPRRKRWYEDDEEDED